MRDTNNLYRASNVYIQRFLFKLNAGVMHLYRSGNDPLPWLLEQLDELVEPITSVRVGAQVAAYLRSSFNTGQVIILDQLTEAVDSLRRRAKLSAAELRKLYEANAGLAATSVKVFKAAVEKKMLKSLADIIQQGLHVREGSVEVVKAMTAAGITPQNSFHAEALFRTQTQFAYSSAQFQANENPFIQDLLWGYRYVTAGDDRVRPEHEALDGTTAPKNDPIWDQIWPPNGWACRCQVVEIWADEVDQHKIEYPPAEIVVDGKTYQVGPDKGFDINAGKLRL